MDLTNIGLKKKYSIPYALIDLKNGAKNKKIEYDNK
jgi:hypothetical protein